MGVVGSKTPTYPDESGRTTSPKGGTTNFTNYSMPLISPNILGNKYIATMIV